MNAFLTGSHVYGTPTDKSDVDLVVPISVDQLMKLKAILASYGINAKGCSIEIGPLNLICLTSDKLCEAWRRGTTNLEARKPVTTMEAIDELDRCGCRS